MIIVTAYHYYAPDATHPVLCECRDGYVWFWDSDRAVPMANFPGRFVPLTEQREPKLNNVPLYSNEQIDNIVDKHIFLDNGTSTYRVWEDRANKYLREMRDRYEKELAF